MLATARTSLFAGFVLSSLLLAGCSDDQAPGGGGGQGGAAADQGQAPAGSASSGGSGFEMGDGPTQGQAGAPSAQDPDKPQGTSLGEGWFAVELGSTNQKYSPQEPPAAQLDGDSLTLFSSSLDCAYNRKVSDEPDCGYFVYRELTGDGSITVRVEHLPDNFHAWGNAGVTFRADTTDLALHSTVAVTRKDGEAHTERKIRTKVSSAGNNTFGTDPHEIPSWLRIERQGNEFTNLYSTDGKTWLPVGETVTLSETPETMLVGLVLAPRYGGATVEFGQIQISGN